MTFTADTFKDLCEVIATADLGCPECTYALADEMAKRWPEFPWVAGVQAVLGYVPPSKKDEDHP